MSCVCDKVGTSDSVLATLGNKQELPMKIKILLIVGFVFLCLSPAPNSSLSKTVEEVLTEFNKLGSSERQKKLEEGARKEGFLKFSSNESLDSIQVLHNAFAARYPFIKLESSREPGLRGVTRIILEHRAGRLVSQRPRQHG